MAIQSSSLLGGFTTKQYAAVMTSTTVNVPIDFVDTTKSWIQLSWSVANSTNRIPYAKFTSGTNIELKSDAADALSEIEITVIENN